MSSRINRITTAVRSNGGADHPGHTLRMLLYPLDLVYRYGYDDEDANIEEIVTNWACGSWPSTHVFCGWAPIYMYIRTRAVTGELILQHVMPTVDLPPGFQVEGYGEGSNPLHIVRVNDQAVSMNELAKLLQSLPPVRVEDREVVTLCENLFPYRSDEWLTLYDTLIKESSFIMKLAIAGSVLRMEPIHVLKPVLDELAFDTGKAGLELANELLTSRHTKSCPRLKAVEVMDILKAVRSLTA